MNKYYIVGIVLSVVAVSFIALKLNPSPQPSSTPTEPKSKPTSNFAFSNPKKSAHYESNTPVHASTLAGVPINVVIDFNFDLAKPSEIKILKDSQDYSTGETKIDESKLALRKDMKPDSPDGSYVVEYKACWPDGSCHDGSFQFAIDRSRINGYSDQTEKKEVTIKMSEIMFKPQNIKIGKDTKIIWINDESTEHYVNTDSHPAHTYHPPQNSKLLKKGESFSLIFDQSGIYPYHCSTHATSMQGNILVE